jgi:OTU domain-containing protein 3
MGKKVKASAAAASSPTSKADSKHSQKLAQQHNKSRRSHAQSASGDDAVHYTAFSSQLSSLSLRLQSITGDGNCLFRSVADQVDGSQLGHNQYRALACKEIAAHPDLYAPFIDDSGKAGKAAAAASGLSSSSSLLAAYVDVMKRDGEWGGNLELVALSRALARDVVVHQMGAPRLVIESGAGSRQQAAALHIAYHSEEHYSSIRRADDPAPMNAPPLPISLPALSSSSSAPPSSAPSGVERMVMERSGCSELHRVRLLLRETDGDSESAVEILKGEREAERSERQDRQRQQEQQEEEEKKLACVAAAEQETVRKPALTAKERRQALKAERAEKKVERARERKQERIRQKAEEQKDDCAQNAKSAVSSLKQAGDGDAESVVQDFGSLSI